MQGRMVTYKVYDNSPRKKGEEKENEPRQNRQHKTSLCTKTKSFLSFMLFFSLFTALQLLFSFHVDVIFLSVCPRYLNLINTSKTRSHYSDTISLTPGALLLLNSPSVLRFYFTLAAQVQKQNTQNHFLF